MDKNNNPSSSQPPQGVDIAWTMTIILGTMVALLMGIASCQERLSDKDDDDADESKQPKQQGLLPSRAGGIASILHRCLPNPQTQPSKYAYEVFVWSYTPIWVLGFACTIYFQWYEHFTASSYTYFGLLWATPLLLQPLFSLYPITTTMSHADQRRPIFQRYCFKANVWIAVYALIGNYWYTHYFYSVLQAQYTMPSPRFNNVPYAMYFCTHFYFSTYHALSNACLRYVTTTYRPGPQRTVLFVSVVIVLSYWTAFTETLSISAFPYYSFQDRTMAYTIGSAFYGIYFLVSFPAFFYFDDHVDDSNNSKAMTWWDTIVSSCGYGMIILFLLDFVRLYLAIPLVINLGPR